MAGYFPKSTKDLELLGIRNFYIYFNSYFLINVIRIKDE